MIVKLVFNLLFFIAGIVFTCYSIDGRKPGNERHYIDKSSWTTSSDMNNPNKGSFVVAYAITGGFCLLASAVLLGSLKGKQ